jgi:hypothetical protein
MTTSQKCGECGARVEPGLSFCDACGAVLSWAERNGATADATAGSAAGSADSRSYEGGSRAAEEGSGGSSEGTGRGGLSLVPSPPPSPSPSEQPSGPPTAEPGWDAFARPGGGAGLPRADRPQPVPEVSDPWGPYSGPDGTDGQAGEAGGAPAARETPAAYEMPDPREAPAGYETPAGYHSPGAPPPADPDLEDTLQNEPASTQGPSAQRPNAQGPSTLESEGMTDRARRLLVPVADPEPYAAPSVAPVLPGRPVAQRPQSVRAPGVELGTEGGTPCPWCGTGNRPERHYCARCAMPMAGERHVPGRQLPWWRRLLGFRNRETPWAGDRPRVRRAFDRVLSWLGAAVALTLVIIAAVNIPDGVQATRDHFSKRAPVSPDHVAASHSFPGHGPQSAFDELNNTWWGPGVSESGQGQWIEASFDQPTRLLDLIITPGVSSRADQNTKAALPHRIEAQITTSSGKTTTRDLTLDQGAGGQRRALRVGDVTKVRFILESAYQISAQKQVSIAEIEFFGPSNASSS